MLVDLFGIGIGFGIAFGVGTYEARQEEGAVCA
jgi:hypothetical protein